MGVGSFASLRVYMLREYRRKRIRTRRARVYSKGEVLRETVETKSECADEKKK